jgi:hypothetical protein
MNGGDQINHKFETVLSLQATIEKPADRDLRLSAHPFGVLCGGRLPPMLPHPQDNKNHGAEGEI